MQFKGNEPRRMSAGAAGMDLVCNEDTLIAPGEVVLVKSGTSVAIPEGYFGLVAARSSIANKKALILVNGVGIIDADYRGEIMFPYKNIGKENQILLKDERIGQIILVPCLTPPLIQVSELSATERGEGGFGSTGSGVSDA